MQIEARSTGFMRGPRGIIARLPGGAVDSRILEQVLLTQSLPAGVGGVGQHDANRDMREPAERMIQAIGNTRNPNNFIALEAPVNNMKGRIQGFDPPMNEKKFELLVADAASGLDPASAERIFTIFNTVSR